MVYPHVRTILFHFTFCSFLKLAILGNNTFFSLLIQWRRCSGDFRPLFKAGIFHVLFSFHSKGGNACWPFISWSRGHAGHASDTREIRRKWDITCRGIRTRITSHSGGWWKGGRWVQCPTKGWRIRVRAFPGIRKRETAEISPRNCRRGQVFEGGHFHLLLTSPLCSSVLKPDLNK